MLLELFVDFVLTQCWLSADSVPTTWISPSD